MADEEFKLRLLRTLIKVDSLEKELTGLKNQISSPILDMKVQKTRLNCEKLRVEFERFFSKELVLEMGDYYDQADNVIDGTIDEFIKFN